MSRATGCWRTRLESPCRLNRKCPQADGITACWSFGERQGTRVEDLLHTNNPIVLDNGGAGATPAWSSSLQEVGLYTITCDSSNGGMNTAPVGLPANTTDAHSVTAWVFQLQETTAERAFFSYGNAAGNTGTMLSRRAGAAWGIYKISASNLAVCVVTYNATGWYHFAYTFDGTTNIIYRNGIQVGTTTTAPESATVDKISVFRDLAAARVCPNGTRFSDLRFYDRPLSPGEVWEQFDFESRFDLYNPRQNTVGLPVATPALAASQGAFSSRARLIAGGVS